VYDAHHGLGLYVPMVEHGFQLPATPFRKELLAYLRISPGQLHSNAWWVITTIEAWFAENWEFLGTSRPTVGLLLYYYYFSALNDDWLQMKKRLGRLVLVNTNSDKKFNKANRWNHRFFYLTRPTPAPLLDGIQMEWRSFKNDPYHESSFAVDESLIAWVNSLIGGNVSLAW
jgi:hypothetical protein